MTSGVIIKALYISRFTRKDKNREKVESTVMHFVFSTCLQQAGDRRNILALMKEYHVQQHYDLQT